MKNNSKTKKVDIEIQEISDNARKHLIEDMKKRARIWETIKYLSLPVPFVVLYAIVQDVYNYYKYENVIADNQFEKLVVRGVVSMAALYLSVYGIKSVSQASKNMHEAYALEKRKNLVRRAKTAIESDRKEAREYIDRGLDIQARVR
jgi:hypothetical protein